MKILLIVQGNYGQRIVENIRTYCPADWKIAIWNAPSHLPLIIEEPEEFLPETLPSADLLIALGENPGVGELLPSLVRLSCAKAVIAPVDNQDWFPAGLKNQIKKELQESRINCAFPMPFCSLTEKTSKDEYIRSFARHFGKPKFTVSCSEDKIAQIVIGREASCGSTRFIVRKLIGVKITEAEGKAGLFHHYYPCWASMKINRESRDSLLHHAANMIKLIVKKALLAAQKGSQI